MTRIGFIALALLVLSAISLVSAQYRARQLFIDLETAKAAERKLDVEWRVLQLDQTNYSKHKLIETAAVRDLHMVPANKRMRYLPLPARIAPLPPQPPALPADATAR